MTFETLQYVDAHGDTQEVAVQNLSAAGTVSLKFFPRSHAPGEFHIALPQPPETPLVIPFKSRCVVWACRTSTTGADNSFSGGTKIFQGRRTDNSGEASRSRVNTNIVLSDALWDLQRITLQTTWQRITGGTIASPTYTTFYSPEVVLFQSASWITYSPVPVNYTLTTWQQIQVIIDYAKTYAAGDEAVDIQLAGSGTLTAGVWSAGSGAEFQPAYCNWYPVRCMKCLPALTICLRPHPGVFTEMDYSTTPPTLHFRDRAHMTALDLPYKSTDGAGITHTASNIQPLNELVPDRVLIHYKINGTFNGQPVVDVDYDIYPPGAAASLLSQEFSVDVTGKSRSETVVNFNSEAFDPTDKDLWRLKVPALKQIVDGGQVPNDGDDGALEFIDAAVNGDVTHPKCITVLDDNGDPVDLEEFQYITEDDMFTWMKLDDGSPAQAKSVTVSAYFSYKKITTISAEEFTDSFKEHVHHFRVTLTNAPSGDYILKQVLNTGESIPPNLAERIYTELQPLQWKLQHQIWQVGADATTLPTLVKPGKHKINLVGGLEDWETMNAVPENVSIEFLRTGDGRLYAAHTINCGPVNHLEPGYLIQLYSLFTNRDLTRIDANQRLNGRTASDQVDLSNTSALENSTAAQPLPVTTNHAYIASGVLTGRTIQSAKEVADILGAVTPTPVTTVAEMRTQKPRKCLVCDNTGQSYYAIVQMTGGHTEA